MSKHKLQLGYIIDGGTASGARYLKVRFCESCKSYEIYDMTYELDDSLPVLKRSEYKPKLPKECVDGD